MQIRIESCHDIEGIIRERETKTNMNKGRQEKVFWREASEIKLLQKGSNVGKERGI